MIRKARSQATRSHDFILLEDRKREGIPGRTGAQSGVRLGLGAHPSEAAAPPYPAGASSAARGACRSQRARAAGPRRRPPCPRRRRSFRAELDGRKCRTVPHQIESVQWAPSGFAAGSGSPPNILGGTVCGKGSVFRRRSPVLAGRTGTPFPGKQ